MGVCVGLKVGDTEGDDVWLVFSGMPIGWAVSFIAGLVVGDTEGDVV
jgi:hypothetical protein